MYSEYDFQIASTSQTCFVDFRIPPETLREFCSAELPHELSEMDPSAIQMISL